MGWSIEECRMGFRMQTTMFNCQSNMPSMYKKDLACRACPSNPAPELDGQENTATGMTSGRGWVL